jgi:7-keto-8-aminopelargonate synthetase-like enzyme
LWQRVDTMKNAVINAGWALPPAQSAILPLRVGDEKRAVAVASTLRERGVLVPAIRYPTVARGAARLRLTATATHTPGDIQELATALGVTRSAAGVA